MGVTLYKPGDTHTVNGIPCDLKVFDPQTFESSLEAGWFLSPEACYAEIEEESGEEKEEEFNEEKGPKTDKEIRLLAKDIGVKFWHNKSISRLKVEIEECQQVI